MIEFKEAYEQLLKENTKLHAMVRDLRLHLMQVEANGERDVKELQGYLWSVREFASGIQGDLHKNLLALLPPVIR